MTRALGISLGDLAQNLNGTLRSAADQDLVVSGISPLEASQEGTLVYAGTRAKARLAEKGEALAVITNQEAAALISKPVILVEDPRAAWIKALEFFRPPLTEFQGHSPEAWIDEAARIDPLAIIMPRAIIMPGTRIGVRTRIWPGAFIGEGVVLGEDCEIHPNVVIREYSEIHNRVIIHAGAVIGSDGFGYQATADGSHAKIPQIGNVVLEDDVEIGANATIDRSTSGSTRIGAGTKIDNLVQIAHNVVIGKNNLMAAQVGIAGSTTTGESCVFAGQAGVADHCQVGDKVVVGPQAGVQLRRLKDETVYFGTPAIEMSKMQKILPLFHRLPELLKRRED